MEGIINKDGKLEIKRGEKLIIQNCPYDNPPATRGAADCGDWCSLFGEPRTHTFANKDPAFLLKLCHRELYFEKFKDLRS